MWLAILIAVSVLSAGCGERPIEVDKSPAMQKKRESWIRDLQREGVIAKIEFNHVAPRIWVRPPFHSIDFEHKQNVSAMIWAYHFDGKSSGDFVRLFDVQTGKEIGQYRPARGLRLY